MLHICSHRGRGRGVRSLAGKLEAATESVRNLVFKPEFQFGAKFIRFPFTPMLLVSALAYRYYDINCIENLYNLDGIDCVTAEECHMLGS